MKKIAVISSTDYNDYPTGGMMSFIKDAAPFLSDHFQVDFWGVDAGCSKASFTSGGQNFAVKFFGKVCTGRRIMPNIIRVVWALFRYRKIILAEKYDGLYIHGIPLNLAFPGRILPKRINHVHGLNNPFKGNGLFKRLLAIVYDFVRKRSLYSSDLVFLSADKKGIESFRVEYPEAPKIVKIENFCDTSIFNLEVSSIDKSSYNISNRSPIILFVGRMSVEKDPLLAIQIMEKLISSNNQMEHGVLVMIGDGALKQKVMTAAQELGISKYIMFLGTLPRNEIASWMRTADFFLLTSHFEGYPVVLAEATECGMPIVCPEITGVHDLVLPEKNGEIVNSRNPVDFIQAILNVMKNRDSYSNQSCLVASTYRPEKVLSRICEELSNVL